MFPIQNVDRPWMIDGAIALKDDLYHSALFDDYWRNADDLMAEIAALVSR